MKPTAREKWKKQYRAVRKMRHARGPFISITMLLAQSLVPKRLWLAAKVLSSNELFYRTRSRKLEKLAMENQERRRIENLIENQKKNSFTTTMKCGGTATFFL